MKTKDELKLRKLFQDISLEKAPPEMSSRIMTQIRAQKSAESPREISIWNSSLFYLVIVLVGFFGGIGYMVFNMNIDIFQELFTIKEIFVGLFAGIQVSLENHLNWVYVVPVLPLLIINEWISRRTIGRSDTKLILF